MSRFLLAKQRSGGGKVDNVASRLRSIPSGPNTANIASSPANKVLFTFRCEQCHLLWQAMRKLVHMKYLTYVAHSSFKRTWHDFSQSKTLLTSAFFTRSDSKRAAILRSHCAAEGLRGREAGSPTAQAHIGSDVSQPRGKLGGRQHGKIKMDKSNLSNFNSHLYLL